MGQSENKLGFFEEVKIKGMSYNETIKSLKETFDYEFKVKKFEEILDNFKTFNDDKHIKRFPHETLTKLLIEKKKDINFDLIVQKKNTICISKNIISLIPVHMGLLQIYLKTLMITKNY